VSALEDGTYDVIVVDAVARDDGTIAIDVAVSSGSHRGDVVTLHASGLDRDCVDLLAMPATLVVRDGEPRLTLD
jgi:hypothetical protein